MKPARIVFPGFWFGESSLQEAQELARRGVGGFCVYGGTAEETRDFTRRMTEASPYGRLLFCADIDEDLSEIVTDAPALPSNSSLKNCPLPQDGAYRKGNLLARMARSMGLDWVLAPVVDLGYAAPAFGDVPLSVTHLAGDFIAGLSNGGALNCIKYFPGVSGVLKTLAQMEDAEFVPYKHIFRRADAIMPSDMIFPNIDNDNQAMLSDKMIKGLLKKRLNYKGCVVSFPLFKGRVRYEDASAVKMLHSGVENILAPKDAASVVDAVEREADKGFLLDEIIHAVSNHEMFISKVAVGPEPMDIRDAFSMAESCFKK
ncbi:glycoside hydrolase family 3 N-terminal domain-containing protein [Candidatus Avelusimicrobium alvi]|jgi:beta-glucosidase|uniref:glycoside hydrolase family 3 N-terminal domain-containing protein n=1 Tax=Candidatus Avelusimicrobium alvi TaxID=3416221 RepID=UPI003D0A2166